VKVEEDPFN